MFRGHWSLVLAALALAMFDTAAQAQSPASVPAAGVSSAATRPASTAPAQPATGPAFAVVAPLAAAVEVRGSWSHDPISLQRETSDLWTAPSPSLAAGAYEYTIIVHQESPAIDRTETRVLHVPGRGEAQYPAVPHGDVHVHQYASKTLGVDRQCWVYTPPGYAQSQDSYPLLVLFHAGADTQKTWVARGNVDWLLDQLIADRRARPMVVLMVDRHPRGESVYLHQNTRAAAMNDLQRELFEDAIPLVEQSYRVDASRDGRAVAGPSVGGGQAISIGLANLDRFAWIGTFSGGHSARDSYELVLADASAVNAKLRLLWISCAKDDGEFKANQDFVDLLSTRKITHTWRPTAGAHGWPVWRRDLTDFLTAVFQPPG